MSLVSDAISARGTRWACHVRPLCALLDGAQPAWTGGASRSTSCVRQRHAECVFSPKMGAGATSPAVLYGVISCPLACSGSCWCMRCKSPFEVEHLQNDTEEKWTDVHHLEIDGQCLFISSWYAFLTVFFLASRCRRVRAGGHFRAGGSAGSKWFSSPQQFASCSSSPVVSEILCVQIFEYGSATVRNDVGRCDGANILQTLLIVCGSLVALAAELRS